MTFGRTTIGVCIQGHRGLGFGEKLHIPPRSRATPNSLKRSQMKIEFRKTVFEAKKRSVTEHHDLGGSHVRRDMSVQRRPKVKPLARGTVAIKPCEASQSFGQPESIFCH